MSIFKHLRQMLLQRLLKFYNGFSIRRKLVTAFLLVACVPALLVGAYSLFGFINLNDTAARQKLNDKLRIASLLWEETSYRLLTLANNIARDNTVILNFDLGLVEALGQYGQTIQSGNDMGFLYFLNVDGSVLAGDGKVYASGAVPLLDPQLFAFEGKSAMVFLGTTGNNVLYDQTGLVAMEPGNSIALVAMAPLYNYQNEPMGYVAAGMMFTPAQDAGNRQLMDRWMEQVAAPVMLMRDGQIFAGTDDKLVRDASRLWTAVPRLAESQLQESRIPGLLGDMILRSHQVGTTVPLFEGQAGFPVYLAVAIPEAEFADSGRIALVLFMFFLALMLVATVFMGLKLARSLSRPIQAVAEGARKIVAGDYHVVVPVNSSDEIGVMADEFNVMAARLKRIMGQLEYEIEHHQQAETAVRKLNTELESRVLSRTRELSESNTALADSLSMLRETQKHLVETEKLAALGNLVAGISHELNTPVGVCLTAITYLEGALENGHQDAMRLIHDNLERITERLTFFKQIAASPNNNEKIAVNLHNYLDDIIMSFANQSAQHGIRFENFVPETMEFLSHPNLVYQVFWHLIMNSLQHGFPNASQGVISFHAVIEDAFIVIQCCDDGVGIPKEILGRVFEPFFTTRRSGQQSGLGLYIVHNLVKVSLGGRVEIDSTLGDGTRITIRLPA